MSPSVNKRFTIIAGYDFSETGDVALDQAIDLAITHPNAVLHVIVALEENHGIARFSGQGVDYERAAQIQEDLREIVAERVDARDPIGLTYYVHARLGRPGKEILNLANEAVADTIVVGTHGRRGLERLLLGSVAEQIIRDAHCAVFVARPNTYQAGISYDPDPACPTCTKVRTDSDGKTWWCEEHSKPYVQPHRYSYHTNIAQTRDKDSPLS